MTKEELILKIYMLIQHPLVDPAESVRISAVLDKMSKEDLIALHTNLIGRTQALLDTERIFAEIENQAVHNFDPVGVIKDRINQHPLVDLPLAIAAECLRDHVIDYLAKGIDLKQETELYFQTMRDVIIRDGEEAAGKVESYPEVLKVFLEALRNSNVVVDQSSDKKPFDVKEIIKEYDVAYPFSNINRGSYERATFVDKLSFKKEKKGIVRNLLDYYDFLINESHFEVIGKDSLNELEYLTNPLDNTEEESMNLEINKTQDNSELSIQQKQGTLTRVTNDTSVVAKKPSNQLKSESVISSSPLSHVSITPQIISIPQVIKSTKPALVFNIEDEKEADRHRSKSKSTEERVILEKQIRTFVDEVIVQKNLIFKDEVNKRRFIQLMVSRLKDVRGPLEVAEVLRKPSEAGGLDMTEEKADQVQAIIEQAKKEFELRIKHNELQIPEPIPEPVAPPAPAKIEPPKPAFDAEAAKQWRDQMLRQLQEQNQPVTPPDQTTAPPVAVMPKPQLSDVKAPPKVVGPLEELRSLTLVDFRRLGATPLEALQKIKGKIDLLGESSIGRRVEAVRAWKSSVVYQQYLRLGRESIEQGKSISDIVNAHQMAGDPVLTEQEFTAIADFNAKLRF